MLHKTSGVKTSSVHFMSQFRAGDEVLFTFEGLLVGRVESVRFEGRKVRYQVTLSAECEVPEGFIVGTLDAKGGEAER